MNRAVCRVVYVPLLIARLQCNTADRLSLQIAKVARRTLRSSCAPAFAAIVWRQSLGNERTYEYETAGVRPVHSGQLTRGPANLEHKIEVTDADAASGKHCLRLAEGKNSERSCLPFLHYSIGVETGPVRAPFRLKMPSATPPAMYFSFRDYHNTGEKSFQTGPKIEIDARDALTSAGSGDVRVELPRDIWVRVDMAFDMSPGKPQTFDMTVEVPGQEARACRDVPYVDPGFTQVSDIHIVSTGPDGGAFLIDDVHVWTSPAR